MTTTEMRADTLVGALRAQLHGHVVDRDDPRYDDARRVWNGLIDRHPTVIARCTSTADVVEAVRVARAHRPVVSIRGGGHQVAGSAVCDDGLVIDLSVMTAVHVDPIARTVRAQAGARWADVDRATQLFGLATPGGEVSDTGIAGFTLGGGMGVLQRAHGLACDNLRSVEIVTADGAVRNASRDEHTDLFWALRGGGRGLGVVTSFEFDLHPIGPQVAKTLMFYPYEQAARVLRAWRDLVPQLPDTVSPEFALWNIPPKPQIPAELHGCKVAIVAGVYAGPPEEAAPVLAPLAELSTPMMDAGGTFPYVEMQRALDPAFPAGGRYLFKSHFLAEVSDAAVDAIVTCDAGRPNPQSLMVIRTLGGAVARVGGDESAFAHRGARYNLSIDAGWTDPARDAEMIEWARSSWETLRPFGTGGVYLNFAGLEDDAGDADDAAVYGTGARRLAAVRAAYDPDALFEATARRPWPTGPLQ
jgi:FAD/FMN-containing dehydrogenase